MTIETVRGYGLPLRSPDGAHGIHEFPPTTTNSAEIINKSRFPSFFVLK
jgi:hypothetical protein